MRFLKSSIIFIVVLLLQAAALYYIAELLPQPFYAVPFVLIMPVFALLTTVFYLGYNDKVFLLLLEIAVLLGGFCLVILPLVILLPEYVTAKGCILYCIFLLLPLVLCGFSARAIYLQKCRKNKE